jgi:type II secretory pathway pseudopilin PulG
MKAPRTHASRPGLARRCLARIKPQAQCGAFLVELAIVMLIVGLMLGGVMSSLSQQDVIKRTKRTDERLVEVREALMGFAVANGRLPRPATSPANGAERAACATEAQCTGFLPWAALGLQPLDGFDKLIAYSVTPAFANAAFTLTSLPTKAIQTRNNAGALVFLAGAAGCAAGSGCVPAVVHSFGKDNWGTTVDGLPMADGSGTNVDEDSNAAATLVFIRRDTTTGPTAPGGEFDDQLTWLPLPVLQGRMVQAGRLP